MTRLLIMACVLCAGTAAAAADPPAHADQIAASTTMRPHPRLLVPAAQIASVRQRIEADPLLRRVYESEKRAADALLGEPELPYEKQGLRLLAVSREALARVTRLAMLHRIAPDPRYVAKAKAELLAVANFPDWNPSHFLDTAEMAAAVAIGYDWLYDELDEPTRETLRRAIVEKALKPSFVETGGNPKHLWWVTGDNNWNQVCHGGLTLAALAMWEHDAELSAKTVRRAVELVPRCAMKVYAPDGDYPEGPGYWEYGTMYNVLLVEALRSALGSDFGIAAAPGFEQTAVYQNQVTGPTTRWFNYADCGPWGGQPNPYLSWFAREYRRPDYALFERRRLEAALKRGTMRERMTGALTLVWFDPAPVEPDAVRMPLSWTGRSKNPVAAHRSSWTDERATYLAVKGGRPGVTHGQQDVGTFVFEADFVRWVCDLGREDYHRIESRGMKLWDMSQDSDRWKIFRQQAAAHSVVTIDGRPQDVNGFAPVVSHVADGGKPNTTIDLTAVHTTPVKRHHRNVALVGNRRVGLIHDELDGLAPADVVEWAMVTDADVTVDGNTATLTRDGKRLTVKVDSPNQPALVVADVSAPPNEWDSPTPRAKKLIVKLTPDASGAARVTVLLTRDGSVR